MTFYVRAHRRYNSSYLKGPLISVCPHVNTEGGLVGKLLQANIAAEAGSIFGLGERPLEMIQHVLLQGTVGGKSAAAGPHWAFQRRLARVRQSMKVEALLSHAAVATKVALHLWEE